TCPPDAVGDHTAHVPVVVDGIVLVTGAEVEDLPLAAAEGAAGAEHLSPAEGGDEHELVGDGDVEVLAVHLLLVDHDRVGHALGDRVGGVHRPHQLAVGLVAPPQSAGGAHQAGEGLGPVTRVEHHQPHAGQHVLLHPLGDLVGDLAVGHVPPPGEDVGLREHLLREAVLGVVQEGDAGGDSVPVVGDDAVADRRVHAVGIELAHARVTLLVAVLAPDGHAQGRGGRGDSNGAGGGDGGEGRRDGEQQEHRGQGSVLGHSHYSASGGVGGGDVGIEQKGLRTLGYNDRKSKHHQGDALGEEKREDAGG